MPIVCRSSCSCEVFSPNSSRASRPTRQAAPVSGARIESPEQSAKYDARTRCHFWVVVCQPVTETICRSPSRSSHSAAQTEQLRSAVMFSSARILPQRSASQSGYFLYGL